MSISAVVVSGNNSLPAGEVNRDLSLTQTPDRRLRVDNGSSPNADGSQTIAGLNGTTKATTLNPVPVDVGDLGSGEYETVAASQSDQVLGATGAIGDYLSHIVIIPAVAAAGAVSIKDGSGSAITVFAGGGTTPLPTLAPILVALGVRCAGAGWKITTGAGVSVIGVGNFT